MDQHDWVNEAGYGARRKAERLRAEQSTFIRVASALLGVHTDERAWRKGAEGEEKVGKRLAKLPDGWQVLHDLTIGRQGANLDHLVVGPPGVFTINTKYHSGSVTVYDRAILHNGKKTPYLPKARKEARKVATAVGAVVGRPIEVQPMLVFVGPLPDIKRRPKDVVVTVPWRIPRWFKKRKAVVLDPTEVTRIAAAACLPQTWGLEAPPVDPRSSGVAAGHHAASKPASDTAEEGPGEWSLTTNRWQRFGHDRLYVNTGEGETLGYLDLVSDELHVDDPSHQRVVECAVREWHGSRPQ